MVSLFELENLAIKNDADELKAFEFKEFLGGDKYLNINMSLILDFETYNKNSQIRLVQIQNVENKQVIFYLHGSVEDGADIKLKDELLEDGYKFILNICNTEENLVKNVVNYIKAARKTIVGHNIAGFDFKLLMMKMKQYDVKDIRFYDYTVGSGMAKKNIVFSYEINGEDEHQNKSGFDFIMGMCEKEADEDFGGRIPVVDTMYLLRGLDSPASLKEAAKTNKWQKQDVDFRVFENEVLGYDALKYAAADILAIPEVYQNIKSIIEPVSKYLSIETKPSQMLIEHAWQKGAGCLAESYLNRFLKNVSLSCPDHATKYFGGLTRSWVNTEIFKAAGNCKIHYLDFTSAYTFSIGLQGILDVLTGNVHHIIHEKNSNKIAELYPKLIYSAVLDVKLKQGGMVLVELERQKNDRRPNKSETVTISDYDGRNNGSHWGCGYVRSFDGDEIISDVQHDFGFVMVPRGAKIPLKLTKTEFEMNCAREPDFIKKCIIVDIVDGLIPLSDVKSREYLELFKIRKQLKDEGNPAQNGIKRLILSVYGKLAEDVGAFFSKACAAAITGFIRYQLFSTILYAKSIGAIVIQSDTDSLYAYCNDIQVEKIQKYADKINPLVQEYGSQNLKLEDSYDLFWGVKRKRYLKVKGGKVKITGENGNRDIRWMDILFRLCASYDPQNNAGEYDLNVLREKIKNNDCCKEPTLYRDKFELFSKKVYSEYYLKPDKKVSSILPVDTPAEITNMVSFHAGTTISYNNGSSQEKYLKSWAVEVRNNILKQLQDKPEYAKAVQTTFKIESLNLKINDLQSQLSDLDIQIKNANKILESKWYRFYELIANHIGIDYGESIFDSNAHKDFKYYFKTLAKDLNLIYDDTSNFYLRLYEHFRDYSVDRKSLLGIINRIAPEGQKIDLEHIDVKTLQQSKEQILENIELLNADIQALETSEYKKVMRDMKILDVKPYVGLFFNANRDYTFTVKPPEDIDFELNYQVYKLKVDYSPIITLGEYDRIVMHQIPMDTIYLKGQKSLSMSMIKDVADQKRISNALYNLNHTAVINKEGFKNRVLKLWIEISDEINPETGLYDVNIISGPDSRKRCKDAGKDSMYHDAEIYISPIKYLQFGFQINKVRMFAEMPTIFNLTRFLDCIDRSIRSTLMSKLEAGYTIQNKKSSRYGESIPGVKFSIPRITVSQQVDVCQPVDRGMYEMLHDFARDTKMKHIKANEFYLFRLMKYMRLSCYNKNASAMRKLGMQLLNERQEMYFIGEAREDFRAEIKFTLKQNVDATLSYAYLLSVIDQESLSKYIMTNGKFTQKRPVVTLTARTNGIFEFSEKKCIILFSCGVLVKTNLLIETQGMSANTIQENDELYKYLLAVLDRHGASTAKPPPCKVKKPGKASKSDKWSDIILFNNIDINDVIWRINPKLLEEFDNDYDNIRERGFID